MGGMVVSLPEIDRLNWHKSECEEKLAMTMAGKAAEIIKYGEENVSNGPAGDHAGQPAGAGYGAALGHVRKGRQYRLFRSGRGLFGQYRRVLGFRPYQRE